jgi:uncharacterized protein YbjT (DUF2867 family)
MRIAVAGGTGLVGTRTVAALADAGHDPVRLARSLGVDLTTGAGLDAALVGVDAVVDVSNVVTLNGRRATAFFEAASGHLVEAAARAGVRHLVTLSIVGVDRMPVGYYRAKLRQEELALAGRVPATVLRSTQFHEFAVQFLAGRRPVAVVPRMLVQPVAAAEVAAALVRLAQGPAQGRAPDLAGPQQERLVDMVRRLRAARGARRPVVGLWAPVRAARLAAGGALLPEGPGPRGHQTYAEWLERLDQRD